MKNVFVIGAGSIGALLEKRLKVLEYNVLVFRRRNHAGSSFEELLKQHHPIAAFVAISTLDNGEAARDYILACVKAGIPVITCEKGALAYYADILKPYFPLIGYSAAVGGGTELLNYVKGRYPNSKLTQIHAVLNGTLNFVFDEMRRGRSLGEACAEASKLGYTEPGATDDPLSLVNGELDDVIRKICVFFNLVLARGEFLNPDMLEKLVQTAESMEQLSQHGGDCRLIVSFSNHSVSRDQQFFGQGFNTTLEGWNISGGFRHVGNLSEFTSWLPGGVGNAVHVIEGKLGAGGQYTLSGPGAGAEPTTSAMLNNFNQLCL